MRRSAPAFWDEPAGLAAGLLAPLAAGWGLAGRLRRIAARPYVAPVPIVCVGNLVVGGAGKTPVVLALADRLAAEGLPVHIVSRGYGGRAAGPLRVDPDRQEARLVGDEALLLARHAPAWVARDRAAGVHAAAAAGAGAILLDDGLQNPRVAKTLSLLVVDAKYGFGNGCVIPAGPLRESIARGLAHADAVILLGRAEPGPADALRLPGQPPVISAAIVPVNGAGLRGARLLAFTGIGRPQKFFATLRALGAELVATRQFPDHHPFRLAEVEALRREAERMGTRLVTTAKDIVRLPAAARGGIEVLEIAVEWPDPAALDRLLAPIVNQARTDASARRAAE